VSQIRKTHQDHSSFDNWPLPAPKASEYGPRRQAAVDLLEAIQGKRQRGRYTRPENVATAKESRAAGRKKKYGMSVADFDAMLAAQGGGCAICGVVANDAHLDLHVDHDHATGVVRGILCPPCNHGLGMFRDNPARMAVAIEYLTRSAVAQSDAA
jgi:hypothetical protein